MSTLASTIVSVAAFFTASNVGVVAFFTPPNPCKDAQPYDAQFTDENGVLDDSRTIKGYFNNRACAEMMDIGFSVDLPQAGMDVTDDGTFGVLDYKGTFDPIMENYADTDLCPVNVHWHMGTEHRSEGEYDETGSGPHPYDLHGADAGSHGGGMRQLAGDKKIRQGMLCHHYDEEDSKFTTPYEWKYCGAEMEVGQTYEVHWPHSAAGMCNTKWQYQYPFYDGVFCTGGVISLGDEPAFNVNKKVGVQGQVFVIVNSDEPQYQNDDLFSHAWIDESHWVDVAKYVGSTTGTSRDNEECSMYAPITWQVDRKCHMVSAKSFDIMCKKMLEQADDLTYETHPHGARELVNDTWSSANVYRKQ